MKTHSTFDSVEIIYSKSSFYKIYNVPTYNYLLEDVLIDTSFPKFGKKLLKELKGLSAIVLTHEHVDHSGNSGMLSKEFKCPIYAHSSALAKLKEGISLDFVFKKLFGDREGGIDALETPTEVKTHSFTLQSIHLPGHSPCCVGYYESDKKWLFTGDVVPLAEEKRDCFDFENMPKTLESLKKIAKLEINVLFTGHRGVITDVEPFLQNRISYLEKISKRIQSLYQDGFDSKQIRNKVFGREKAYSYFIGGDRSSLNTVRSFLTNKAVKELSTEELLTI